MTAEAISRREFLERLGILGGLEALYSGMSGFGLLPTAQAATGRPELEHRAGEGQHIVILGAGVAGLCAAYLLRNTGFKVTMVEPNSHVGGRCLTLRKGSDQSLLYRGTSRGGYRQKPGAGLNAGILRPQFELQELLGSEFWEIGLFNDMYLYWQASLMQPEDGMDKIPKAFLNHLGPNTRLQLNVKALGITRTADKILIKLSSSEEPIRADYCIATMVPPLLSRILDSSFSQKFRKSLADIYMVPSFKFGWQARSRFWEEENEIYGGISWTKHIITQLWYPSYGFHSQKGVLTGAYNYGRAAGILGLMPQKERMVKALNGGEKFHPGLFEQNVEKGISIAWQNMPNQAGGWAYYRNQAANPEYSAINQPQGRLVLAGDYMSFISGWMEGAVRSAELAVERIAKMAQSQADL